MCPIGSIFREMRGQLCQAGSQTVKWTGWTPETTPGEALVVDDDNKLDEIPPKSTSRLEKLLSNNNYSGSASETRVFL